MARKVACVLAVLGLLPACSSRSPSSSSTGACDGLSQQSNLSVTASLIEGFTSLCPTSIPLNLASERDASTEDANTGDCTPVVSDCVLTISCNSIDANGTTTISARVTATGNSLSGTETVTVPVSGGNAQSCTYSLTGTFS